MNGKRAKALRKKVMGDFAMSFRKYKTLPSGQIIDTGPHGTYRKKKKGYLNERPRQN